MKIGTSNGLGLLKTVFFWSSDLWPPPLVLMTEVFVSSPTRNLFLSNFVYAKAQRFNNANKRQKAVLCKCFTYLWRSRGQQPLVPFSCTMQPGHSPLIERPPNRLRHSDPLYLCAPATIYSFLRTLFLSDRKTMFDEDRGIVNMPHCCRQFKTNHALCANDVIKKTFTARK